jgi:hypothetical protein
MAAPDTSFQPSLPREERHPGVDVREHPVSPPANVCGVEGDYLAEIQRLAMDAHAADAHASQGIAPG